MPTKTTKTSKTTAAQDMFKMGVETHGAEDVAAVARVVGTRTGEQVSTYAAAAQEAATQGTKKRGRSAQIASRSGGCVASSDDDKAQKKEEAAIPAPDAAAAPARHAKQSKPNKSKPTPTPKARGPTEGHWTEAEHSLFLACWAKHGKAWKKIAAEMKTRSNEQIRTHAQKYFTKLEQLRHCGYDGDYSMDGTRHLTKSFVTKAKQEGRMVTDWPPQGWVNPLRAQSRSRRRPRKATGADPELPAAVVCVGTTNPAWRRSVRTAMEEAEAKAKAKTKTKTKAGDDKMDIDDAPALAAAVMAVVAGEEEDEAEEAPQPLLPLPPPLDCHHHHHATAPCMATAAGSLAESAGSEQGDDDEDEEDARAYGELNSAFLDGRYDDLPPTAAAAATVQEDERMDHPGFLLNEYMCMGGCIPHYEVGQGLGEQGKGDTSAVLLASTAGAVVAIPVGADAPTHDEVMLNSLLGGADNSHIGSGDHHHHGSSCDSSVGWGAEAAGAEEEEEEEDDATGDGESHLLPSDLPSSASFHSVAVAEALPDVDLIHERDEHHDQENEQPTTTIHWHGKCLAIQF